MALGQLGRKLLHLVFPSLAQPWATKTATGKDDAEVLAQLRHIPDLFLEHRQRPVECPGKAPLELISLDENVGPVQAVEGDV